MLKKLLWSVLLLGFYPFPLYSENEILDLEIAWQRVLAYAPSLEVAEKEVGIKNAETHQVSLRPNPVAGIEFEDIWGSGIYRKWQAAQATYSLWQTVELGGKRSARERLASSQTDEAFLDAQIAKHNLRYELETSFITTYQAQEKLKIAEERLKIAQKTLEIVDIQVQAGKASPIQKKRMLISLKSAEVALRESQSQFIQAKKKLAAMWGNLCPHFEAVAFGFFEYTKPISCCGILESLFGSPDLAKAQQEKFVASQNLKLQQANSVPDLTLRAGYRTYNETKDHAFVIEAQLPIPIFNQNQGNIAKAQVEIDQSLSKQEELIRSLEEKLAVIHEQFTASFDKAEFIQNHVLAEAKETFHLTEIGYQKGKLQYLDLLDAQKTLFEIQEQYIDILTIYHLKKAEIDRWTGYLYHPL